MPAPEPLIVHLHEWSRPRGSVISRRGLLARAVGPARIGRLVDRGVLHPKHRGVYAVGRADVPPYGEAWAAYLATRGRGDEPRARALTGRSGLALLGAGPVPSVPEVVVAAGEPPRVAGVRTTSTRGFADGDLWVDGNGLAITSWPQTILSLAPTSSVADLEDALDRSDRRGLLDLLSLDEAMRTATHRVGLPKLRRALEPFIGLPPAEYRSLLERIAHVEFRKANLPEPEINGAVELLGGMTIRVDLLLRDAFLGVELDGRDTHERARQFETDRWRDRELQKLGISILRFPWRDVKQRPWRLTDDVRAVLGHRSVRFPSR